MADVKHRAFAGVRNTAPRERMLARPNQEQSATDLTQADNVDLDNTGQVSRRIGTELKVSGPAHSLWADGDDCFFMQDINLRRLNPDLSSTLLAQGLTRGLAMNFVKVNGRTYFTNGRQTGLIDRFVRSWGLTIPNPPNAALVQGNLAGGKYTFALTHMRADGQESGAGMGAQIDVPDNGGIVFSWARPDDPGVSQIGLYLSEPNGAQLYRALLAPADATSATVTSLHSALPLQTQWLDAPPPGQCLAYQRGRIFIAAGSVLYATNALGYEYCDLRDFLNVDNTAIRFVIGVDGGLYVGTESRVYFVSGTRLDEFAIRPVVDSFGVARSALAVDGLAATGNPELAGQQVALFATGAGVCLGLPDGSVSNLTDERFRFDAPPAGAALFRRTHILNQYLLTVG